MVGTRNWPPAHRVREMPMHFKHVLKLWSRYAKGMDFLRLHSLYCMYENLRPRDTWYPLLDQRVRQIAFELTHYGKLQTSKRLKDLVNPYLDPGWKQKHLDGRSDMSSRCLIFTPQHVKVGQWIFPSVILFLTLNQEPHWPRKEPLETGIYFKGF